MSDETALRMIHLSGQGNEVSVVVTGRFGAGVPEHHDHLSAQLVVDAGVFRLHAEDVVTRGDLDEWSRCLDALSIGDEATWRDTGRTIVLTVAPDDGGAIVTILDEPGSGAQLVVPVQLADGWVLEQAGHLRAVLDAYPAETVETSPGVWTWARPS